MFQKNILKAINDNVEQSFRGPFMNREKRRPRSSTSDLIWANNLSYKDNLLLISLPFSEKNPKISSKDDGTWDFNCHLVRDCEWMSWKESKIIGYICRYSPWIFGNIEGMRWSFIRGMDWYCSTFRGIDLQYLPKGREGIAIIPEKCLHVRNQTRRASTFDFTGC